MRTKLDSKKSILSFINDRMSELGGWILVFMVVLLSVDLVSRGLGKPIQGLTTLSVLILISTVYLGLARCEEKGEHANIDLLPSKLPVKGRVLNIIIVHIIELITISIFLYGTIGSAISSYNSSEIFADVVKIPMWPAKIFVSIGIFIYALQILTNLIDSINRFRKGMDVKTNDVEIDPNMF